MSQKSDNIALIDKIVSSENMLYDMQDHLKDVESFFKTQVSIFDNAASFVDGLKNDLDYISHDPEAEHALNQMRLITHIIEGKEYDYKRIPELNELKLIVENHMMQCLKRKERTYMRLYVLA